MESYLKRGSMAELRLLIVTIQERMGLVQVKSSYFKASLIVNRRLLKEYKQACMAIEASKWLIR